MSAIGPKDTTSVITEVVCRAPEWLRVDLSSTDRALRSQAEETLAAMIAAALEDAGTH